MGYEKGKNMFYDILNVLSLILAMLSLVMPFESYYKYKSGNRNKGMKLILIGFSSAVLVLFFQIMYLSHLVKINDIESVVNNLPIIEVVLIVFVVLTLIMNFLAYISTTWIQD